MKKKITKSISFELTAQESVVIHKAQSIILDILDLMDTEDCDTLILEHYEVTQNYSEETLEGIEEFLDYLSYSDNEVV